MAALMLAFYEDVPESLRLRLTWHPTPELRALAEDVPDSLRSWRKCHPDPE
ncbi:MAG TPA: hypothetical protein VFT74_04825 [Isosphaeraceae bacterium]|nr:hypothetical protein [Isosphaeraceae bacterium]